MKRIQRKRTKSWKMPPGAIYVGRPTKWGNPFRAGIDGTAAECVEMYRKRIAGNVWTEPNAESIRKELAGHDLVCWCKPGDPCHADVLIEICKKARK